MRTIEEFLARLAKALDDLAPDLPPGWKAVVLAYVPEDPDMALLVGATAEELTARAQLLATDPFKNKGIARASGKHDIGEPGNA